MWDDDDVLWLYYTELQERGVGRVAISTTLPNLTEQENETETSTTLWEDDEERMGGHCAEA